MNRCDKNSLALKNNRQLLKKLCVLLTICLCLNCGCAKDLPAFKELFDNESEVVEISEHMFVTLITEIYTNSSDYIGKTIKYEGFYDEYISDDTTYKGVYRRTYGCCGDDGMAGFEIVWQGEGVSVGDWVEVSGKLEEYVDELQCYLRLNAVELRKLDISGLEFVTQ